MPSPKIARRMRSRFISWVAGQVRADAARRHEANAVLGPQVMIAPEGEIENCFSERENIRVGGHCYIRGRLLTLTRGAKLSIGEWCYVGRRSEVWSMESVTIGNRVLIAHDVNIHDHTAHSRDASERHAHFRQIIEKGHPSNIEGVPGVKTAPVVIEDDVWISFGVTILKGVRIGAGSIVAARALVTKDIPPGVFYYSEATSAMTPLQGQPHKDEESKQD